MVDASQKKLEYILRKIASEQSYENYELEIKHISSGGANYSSNLFIGNISAPNKDDLKIFAKVAIMGESIRSMMPTNIYHTEQYFYSRLADIFAMIQDKHNIPEKERLSIPRMYGYDATAPDEIIVLQDLASDGFVVQDRFQSFNWEYAASAVQQLARLHALSIAMKYDHPNEYEEVSKTLKVNADSFDAAIKYMEETSLKSVAIIKEENKEVLRNYLKNNFRNLMEALKSPRCQKVLLHGDFRMSNIMHKVQKDNKVELTILDYQTMMFGTPVNDLLYFIFTGSDKEFRRWYFHPLLDQYYEQFSLSLTRLQLNPAKILPKHEFDRELKQHFGLGLVFAMVSIPIVTVELDEAPALNTTLDLDALMNLTPSQLCTQRLNDVVQDYINWGIL
ncbi:unnamed protein product [Diatraea saccharalis]|uniref:CHK kinase-like domain-containing protein n=1 Tax=Diatraea saccharalis TaxID=40085 RepID=A0A9N9RGX2_9NEOP|nr:unnamed protein product [Diatraea saccharalis]